MNKHEQEILDSVESKINKTFDFLREYGDVKGITRTLDVGEGFTYRIEKDGLWAILDMSVSVLNSDDIIQFEYTYRDNDDKKLTIRKAKSFFPYGHSTDDGVYGLSLHDNCLEPYINILWDMKRLYEDGEEIPHDRKLFDLELDSTPSDNRSLALAYLEIAKTVIESELGREGKEPKIEEKLTHQWNGMPIHVSYSCGDWIVSVYVTDTSKDMRIVVDIYALESGRKGWGDYYRLNGSPVLAMDAGGPFIDRFRGAFRHMLEGIPS